jgi:hypothetical protein
MAEAAIPTVVVIVSILVINTIVFFVALCPGTT